MSWIPSMACRLLRISSGGSWLTVHFEKIAWIFVSYSLPFYPMQVPQGIILQTKQPTSTSQAAPVLNQFSSQPSSVLVSSQGQPVTVTTSQAPPHGHVSIPATIQPPGSSKVAPVLEKGQVQRGGQPAQSTALLQQQTPVLVKSASVCKLTPLWWWQEWQSLGTFLTSMNVNAGGLGKLQHEQCPSPDPMQYERQTLCLTGRAIQKMAWGMRARAASFCNVCRCSTENSVSAQNVFYCSKMIRMICLSIAWLLSGMYTSQIFLVAGLERARGWDLAKCQEKERSVLVLHTSLFTF